MYTAHMKLIYKQHFYGIFLGSEEGGKQKNTLCMLLSRQVSKYPWVGGM